jgi:phosphatidylinositol alpha-1,6-mannosyltransferase
MGGIERVCRIFGKALCEMQEHAAMDVQVYSMYDETADIDERYFPVSIFRGFGIQKRRFIVESIRQGIKSDIVIISHVNLLPVAFCIKLFSPKTKLVLLAHGIEVWKKFAFVKKLMLKRFDAILAVSNFTRNKMMALNGLPESKFIVLNNCLDPYLPAPVPGGKDPVLMKKYGFSEDDIILMTITRLSSKEKYKNCDRVLATMQALSATNLQIKYLLVGACDDDERARIEKMSEAFGVRQSVIITGFIPDSSIPDYYNLADIFIMLSEREGFGIVFIEAMYYGKPVIGANRGGVTDALAGGAFGILVEPADTKEVATAIKKIAADKAAFIPDRSAVLDRFGYTSYRHKLEHIMEAL